MKKNLTELVFILDRSGHDGIIGEVRFLAQQRKILVLVIVVVKFIGTAHHIT